jgi:hypothetical protein
MWGAVILLIWAFIDPVGAAGFVSFLWLRIEEGLATFFTFVRETFN